jgi:hypothetical protein
MFIAHHVSWSLLCFSHLQFAKSSLEMDAFKLLDSYANELAIVGLDNLVVNKLESYILLEEVLQVQGVADEEQEAKEEALWKQKLTPLTAIIKNPNFFIKNFNKKKPPI